MNPVRRPIRFSYDEPDRALIVEWDDGSLQTISFAALRKACPCALCEGEMGFTGRFVTDPELREGEDELADITLVGAYAVNPIWADGHDTGIVTFPRLWELRETTEGAPPVAD